MKSAYELAMERLARQSPTVRLSAEQKQKLAEIDARFRARIAEREIFLDGERAKAIASGDFETLAQLDQQFASERKALQAECEEEKEKVRQEAAG